MRYAPGASRAVALGLATWPTAATRAGQSVSPAPCGSPAGAMCAVTAATRSVARGAEAAIVDDALGACVTDVAIAARGPRAAGRRLNRETVTVKNIGLLALTLLAGLALAPRLGAEITPGMTIDQTTAGQARDLLPPEIYE